MPSAVRRKLPGPAVTTGRGISASGDKRTNVRWSEAEALAGAEAAKAAGQTHAEHVRTVYLKAIGFEAATPAQPKVDAPWLVNDDGSPTVAPQVEELEAAPESTERATLPPPAPAPRRARPSGSKTKPKPKVPRTEAATKPQRIPPWRAVASSVVGAFGRLLRGS